MTTFRCSICKNPLARNMIDARLDDGVSAVGISRELEGIGATVTAEVISRHRRHYRDGKPERPKGTRHRDFAVMVRERAVEQFENEELDLANKDHAPGIKAGLQAQSILDKREQNKSKNAMAELGRGLLAMMLGQAAPTALLPDPNTIEGEAVEVEDDDEAD